MEMIPIAIEVCNFICIIQKWWENDAQFLKHEKLRNKHTLSDLLIRMGPKSYMSCATGIDLSHNSVTIM